MVAVIQTENGAILNLHGGSGDDCRVQHPDVYWSSRPYLLSLQMPVDPQETSGFLFEAPKKPPSSVEPGSFY